MFVRFPGFTNVCRWLCLLVEHWPEIRSGRRSQVPRWYLKVMYTDQDLFPFMSYTSMTSATLAWQLRLGFDNILLNITTCISFSASYLLFLSNFPFSRSIISLPLSPSLPFSITLSLFSISLTLFLTFFQLCNFSSIPPQCRYRDEITIQQNNKKYRILYFPHQIK